MIVSIDLDAATSIALRRMAAENATSLDHAAMVALRDWLTAHGYLELEHELDEDTETAGGLRHWGN